LVFITELGDKTQLAVVSQTCKSRRPWPVFLGGSLALTAVTAFGVAGGRLLGVVIPQNTISMVAATAFVVMGLLIWRGAARNESEGACELPEDGACETNLWMIFLAGSLALTAVTAIGVLGGQKLCEWIAEQLLMRISAVAFVVMGVLMGLGVI